MNKQLKFVTVLVGVSVAVVATVFNVFASGPGYGRIKMMAPSVVDRAEAMVATCTTLKAGDVAWVTLTDDGSIDSQVDSYPSDTVTITPVFQYDCVPKKVTIVTVFSLNGEQVFSDKEALKASNAKGVYGYPLSKNDKSAIDEGEWSVEFYNNKTLLTSGQITVGQAGQESTAVTVQGTVKDAKTKKPIKGATLIVLKSGVTIQQFIKGGKKDKDVFTAGQTDSKGQFVLADQLERNTEYSIIAVAKGYKSIGEDGFKIGTDDPNPLQLDITLRK